MNHRIPLQQPHVHMFICRSLGTNVWYGIETVAIVHIHVLGSSLFQPIYSVLSQVIDSNLILENKDNQGSRHHIWAQPAHVNHMLNSVVYT